MALSGKITCTRCHEEKTIMYSGMRPKICHECEAKAAESVKQAHFDALAKLSIEERIKKLENFQYDHSRKYHPGRPVRF